MECGRHSVCATDPLVACAHCVTGAGGALIAREDIKARMIEEAALAVDDELVSALDRLAGNCARVHVKPPQPWSDGISNHDIRPISPAGIWPCPLGQCTR